MTLREHYTRVHALVRSQGFHEPISLAPDDAGAIFDHTNDCKAG